MSDTSGGHRRAAFLLAQVGSASAERFAERTKSIGLTPGEAGVLRLLGRTPGINQRTLAGRVGSAPSRIVALVDRLQERGLVRRTRSAADRRNQELELTDAGRDTLVALRTIAEEHEADILAPLSAERSAQLAATLAELAASLGLDRDLHRRTS